MSRDSIGVVTTGRRKLQEWKTTQKQNLSRKSRGTLTVKWAGSRDKIFSPSGRGRTFFLTSLFIELIDPDRLFFSIRLTVDDGGQLPQRALFRPGPEQGTFAGQSASRDWRPGSGRAPQPPNACTGQALLPRHLHRLGRHSREALSPRCGPRRVPRRHHHLS